MTQEDSLSVLQRMAKAPQPATPDVPLTAARALRLSATRAAEQSVGLLLTVLGVGEQTLDLDALLETLNDDLLILALRRKDEAEGLIAIDRQLAAAIVEVRAMGRVAPRDPLDRRASSADLALIQPFFAGLLAEIEETTMQTALEGWSAEAAVAERIGSVRSVGLLLPDGDYRLVRMTVDLGAADRQGEVLMTLPNHANPGTAAKVARPTGNWAESMYDTVSEAPATLNAILYRFNLPLATITDLQVNQIVPLTGCTVGSVRLEAIDNTLVARARLGQMGGKIAVRVETPQSEPMIDLDGPDDACGSDGMPDLLGTSPAGFDLPSDGIMAGADVEGMTLPDLPDLPSTVDDAEPMDVPAETDSDMPLPDMGEFGSSMDDADMAALLSGDDLPPPEG